MLRVPGVGQTVAVIVLILADYRNPAVWLSGATRVLDGGEVVGRGVAIAAHRLLPNASRPTAAARWRFLQPTDQLLVFIAHPVAQSAHSGSSSRGPRSSCGSAGRRRRLSTHPHRPPAQMLELKVLIGPSDGVAAHDPIGRLVSTPTRHRPKSPSPATCRVKSPRPWVALTLRLRPHSSMLSLARMGPKPWPLVLLLRCLREAFRRAARSGVTSSPTRVPAPGLS